MNISIKQFLLVDVQGEGPGRCEIRVVSWNDYPPVLEKRQIIIDRTTNKERSGKNKGFNREDFILLLEKQEDIQAALRGEEQSDEQTEKPTKKKKR